MRARRIVSVGLLALASGPATAAADLLSDALGPRELATGEARRGDVSGAQAVSLNPAGLPLTRDLSFEGSYGYRSTDAATLISASACDSTNAAPGCFYYRYAGGDTADDRHQRTHVAGLTLARVVNARAMVGVGAKYLNAKGAAADGSEDVKGFNWDLGAVVRLTDQLNLAVVGSNLWGTENLAIARTVAGGATFRPSPQLVAAFDARWNLDTDGDTGRYGGGLEYFVTTAGGQNGYPLRAGAVHDVVDGTYVTGGLGMATVKFGLDVGLRKQVKGGDDLQISASLRVFGPRT
ncbi:MAG: hypothetical protein IPH44_24755 [Myxococcales bacterium]|nr:hypothetical protein [Myxococcales bacterium]MBP6846081.1 hypothetical protein [Kofleriaceae bacterium]